MPKLTDEFQYQLSVALPPCEQYAKGDMVNIRGRNAQEFYNNLTAYDAQMAEQCAEVVANIRAKWAIIGSLGGEVVSQGPSNPQNGAQNASQGSQGYQGQQQQSGPQNGSQGFQGGQQQQYQPQGNQWQGQQQGGYQGNGNAGPADGGIPTSPPPGTGPAPECSHGVKRFIAKANRNGKPGYWMAWACPADRGDQSQHPLQFISNRS